MEPNVEGILSVPTVNSQAWLAGSPLDGIGLLTTYSFCGQI